jgi:hypothetical protein
MSDPAPGASALELVHEGWNHLQSQRPLAAWGSWHRALRMNPDSRAARQALSRLESAPDLPLAARAPYCFRQPDNSTRRAAWDDRIRREQSDDIAAMADLFGRLAAADPGDSAAWYNRALCLAWSGHNREAISSLDRFVDLEAVRSFDEAISAWALAEILRQGAGAENLADDLRFACTIPWEAGHTAWLLDEFPEVERRPTPQEPGSALGESDQVEVLEWLDRSGRAALESAVAAADLPVVLATVYIDAHSLRLSSPRASGLERIEEMLLPRLEENARPVHRDASPLPLVFLDADVWRFRMPSGIDAPESDRLRREAVERYFESEWIHRARQGLGGLAPLRAAGAAQHGDAVARVRLAAVVRVREQLGNRPSAIGLYQGYPFDRLRRRLGLELVDPASVDPLDLSCAPPEELDRLSPSALDDASLLEAAVSAAGLGDDERTDRFGRELLGRQAREVSQADLVSLVAAMVRSAMRRSDFDGAVGRIEQARPLCRAETEKTLETWRAEVLARAHRPESALEVYGSLISHDAAGAARALDAAETMLDNGHLDQARSLLTVATELARSTGRRWIERRAHKLLDRHR